MVISQEFQTTRLFFLELDHVKNYLELNHLALIDGRVFEDVEVEGAAQILLRSFIPVICGKSYLESVHARAIVLEFLIPILNCVVIVLLIFISDVESCSQS